MRFRAAAISLLLVFSASALAGQIYKWVDDHGVTHFDARPPEGKPSVAISPAAPAPSSATPTHATTPDARQKQYDDQVKAQLAEQQDKLKAFCEQARSNLAQLKNNPRVREEVDGEMHRLSEDERQSRMTETQKAVDDNCR